MIKKKQIYPNDKRSLLKIIDNLETKLNEVISNLKVADIILNSIKESYQPYVNSDDNNLKNIEQELNYNYKNIKSIIKYENCRIDNIQKEIIILKTFIN